VEAVFFPRVLLVLSGHSVSVRDVLQTCKHENGVLKRGQRIALLRELRSMNIHSASLFPGLDGFARSLAVDLELSVAQQIEARKEEMLRNEMGYRAKREAAAS
jgi:hypothetical protein